jgi:hypothetical protein
MHALIPLLTLITPMKTDGMEAMAPMIGTWDCAMELVQRDGSIKNDKCTFTFGMDLDGKVMTEEFKWGKIVGKAFNIYLPKENKWKHSWVDDTGGYMLMEGGFKDNQFILESVGQEVGVKAIFSNITPEKFDFKQEIKRQDGVWRTSFTMKCTKVTKS